MRKQLVFIAMAAMCSISGKAQTSDSLLNFNELPYAEGTLYVSVACGEKEILREAIEVDSDQVSLPVNLSVYVGSELSVNAFLDLNENRKLDFDNYGRPTEPCLREKLTPEEGGNEYDLKLIQY